MENLSRTNTAQVTVTNVSRNAFRFWYLFMHEPFFCSCCSKEQVITQAMLFFVFCQLIVLYLLTFVSFSGSIPFLYPIFTKGEDMSASVMIAILVVTTVVFGVTAAWLAYEHKKKFDFMQQFVEKMGDHIIVHRYRGAKEMGLKRGMGNIKLYSPTPFSVLVGFELHYPLLGGKGFDYYGFVESEPEGEKRHSVVIRTFLGTKPCDFVFLFNRSLLDMRMATGPATSGLTPTAVYPPHWYQKYFGFFG